MTERDWIRKHKNDQKVKAWIRSNPPPAEWRGSKLSYAYLNMLLYSKVAFMAGLAFGLGCWWLGKKMIKT